MLIYIEKKLPSTGYDCPLTFRSMASPLTFRKPCMCNKGYSLNNYRCFHSSPRIAQTDTQTYEYTVHTKVCQWSERHRKKYVALYILNKKHANLFRLSRIISFLLIHLYRSLSNPSHRFALLNLH